jgi:hypothetical protein
MTFIQTIPLEEATGLLKEVYAKELKEGGFVDNGTRAFSLRPAAYTAWENLRASIRTNMELRRYELVTIVAAAKLRCSY